MSNTNFTENRSWTQGPAKGPTKTRGWTQAPAKDPTKTRRWTQGPAKGPTKNRGWTRGPAKGPTKTWGWTQGPEKGPTKNRGWTQGPAKGPTKTWVWTQAPAKAKQLLPLIRHPPCFSNSQYVLDTTMHNQTQITQIRQEPSYKQLKGKTNWPSFLFGNRSGHHNTEFRT
jgi:hypothetical protein